MEEVKPAELERIRAERLTAVSPATANREYAFLKHVYNIAIRDGKAESNPVAKLRMLREPSGRTRYLSDEEETRLLTALPGVEDRARLTVLLHTGFRRGELLILRWRDVDFKAGVLTVPKSKNGETRHVPMTSTVRELLSHRPRPLDRDGLVFPNRAGTPDLRWAKKTVPRALADAQIEDFRFHDSDIYLCLSAGHGGRRSCHPEGANGPQDDGDDSPLPSRLAGPSEGGYRAPCGS